jgi:hypothetical protein
LHTGWKAAIVRCEPGGGPLKLCTYRKARFAPPPLTRHHPGLGWAVGAYKLFL